MTQRFLVMGDNHGDAESLRRVLADIEDAPVDAAIHVGDFTTAWRTSRQHDDERLGKERGVEQLREVEPVLEAIDAHASHGLLWVWGNQDYFGDLDYDLDVGTEIPDDGYVEAAGQRFTSSPDRVESDAVLVTHVEKWSLLDHFEGRAHFCGNTHRGRHLGRRLNTAFLKLTDPETETTTYGGYFVVDFGDDSIDVELRSIGDLERKACDRHGERGVRFRPADEDCMHCTDERILFREMAATAFYGLTGDRADGDSSVPDEALVDAATALWDDPPSGFRAAFREYLSAVDDDCYAPLTRTDEGLLAVADRSYAY